MKQLKFMLAATTAVGIAAVAQAATQTNYLFGDDTPTDTFEGADKDTLGRTLTGWSYSDPANAEQDDDSRVALDGEDKVLNVNTGTKPLLRALWQGDNGARPVSLADVQSLYIDTMVQFTVTPDGDTVTAGNEDKLMIYLKEVPAEGDTPASTKLMAKALQYKAGSTGWNAELEDYVTIEPIKVAGDWEVEYSDGTAVEVSANSWYSLKVTTELVDNVPMFNIYLGGKLIKPKTNLNLAESNSAYFPSLLAETSNALTYVGFAGEGMVDDLTVATITEQTSVDFTFAITCGTGVSAVAWTVNDVAQTGLSATVTAGQKIAITDVTYEDWYVADGDYVKDWSMTAAADVTGITVGAKEVTSDDIDVTVPAGTPPATVNAALAWAKAAGKTTAAVEGAANIVANYLLNVADLAVEPKIKITSIDLSGDVPSVTAEVTAADGTTTIKTLTADNINAAASIKYKAAATLDALKNAASKSAIEDGDKFIQVVVE